MHDEKWLQSRINHYRKHFARKVGQPGRHTALRTAAITRAAILAAEADKVLADPFATVNDKVRISGAADRAYASMCKALQDTRQVKAINPFDAYAAAQKATA
jgi:hypothetical protein